jgi:hypothetical protein
MARKANRPCIRVMSIEISVKITERTSTTREGVQAGCLFCRV